MNWAPASLYRTALRGYRPKAIVTKSTVLGRQATTFHYAGRPAYVTVLPPQGNIFVTLALPADEHETLLRSLRAVSVDRWLAAMPPEVVQPAAESAVIAQMLQGVPLPPGFDLTSLEAEGDLTNRFELAGPLPARSPAVGSKAGIRQLVPATPPRPKRRSRR
jgi:hypothetical protein